jgi:hypothetical protein
MTDKKIICVLGMHRSGTSLLTRLLNLIGVDLGAGDQLTTEPSEANPKGYWENDALTLVSDAILKRFGGAWDQPPVFPEEWFKSEAIGDLSARAQQISKTQFSNSSVWGWKDPRTCLTLPFWQQEYSNLQYIICLRDPVAVAASLEARDEFSAEKSCSLWLTYVSSALRDTEGRSRLIVFYEDLMDDCATQVERLAEFVGTLEQSKTAAVQKSISEFVDASLYHHRSKSESTIFASQPEIEAQKLYQALRLSGSTGLSYRSAVNEEVERLRLQVENQARALHQREARISLLTEQLSEAAKRIEKLKKPWTLLKR